MSVVAFDQAMFVARFPEFSGVPLQTLQAYFGDACDLLNNTDASPVTDGSAGGLRARLLNLLVAHISALNYGANGQAPSDLVGRIDQASQGSVSVHADVGAMPGTAAWFMQTKYGAQYWQATASYRTMRYYPGASQTQGPPWQM